MTKLPTSLSRKDKQKQKFYDLLYGEISTDKEERIKYILDCKNSKKILDEFDNVYKSYKKIKYKTLSFTWYTVPHPSARPRSTFRSGFLQTYVPNAAETKKNFQAFFNESFPNFKIIDTPMEFLIKSYAPTPDNFSRLKKLLAEYEIIRPWGRTFDVDNVFKALTDCTIATLIADDSLIYNGRTEKYYSIKPRVEYEIKYMDKFPEI